MLSPVALSALLELITVLPGPPLALAGQACPAPSGAEHAFRALGAIDGPSPRPSQFATCGTTQTAGSAPTYWGNRRSAIPKRRNDASDRVGRETMERPSYQRSNGGRTFWPLTARCELARRALPARGPAVWRLPRARYPLMRPALAYCARCRLAYRRAMVASCTPVPVRLLMPAGPGLSSPIGPASCAILEHNRKPFLPQERRDFRVFGFRKLLLRWPDVSTVMPK